MKLRGKDFFDSVLICTKDIVSSLVFTSLCISVELELSLIKKIVFNKVNFSKNKKILSKK